MKKIIIIVLINILMSSCGYLWLIGDQTKDLLNGRNPWRNNPPPCPGTTLNIDSLNKEIIIKNN